MKSLPRFLVVAVIVLLVFLLPQNIFAQWLTNPSVNSAICLSNGRQSSPKAVSDGEGGAIITWQDSRNGNDDIYAQRINASGIVQWTINGIPICTASNRQGSPAIVSDGGGGAIIVWEDVRNGNNDIYAQRINSTGIIKWAVNGIPIFSPSRSGTNPKITSDRAGGAIIAWEDGANIYSDIYAQRINGAGTVLWTNDGVAVCTAANHQVLPNIVSDGSCGAIITWSDTRSGISADIYAQHVDGTGNVKWTIDGVCVCSVPGNKWYPAIVSDWAGGAVITWHDFRNDINNIDIYAQRINSNGSVQWAVDGVAVCTADNVQLYPIIVSDGAGNVIIAWTDCRDGGLDYKDIYAQRIDAAGNIIWKKNGAAICTAVGKQILPTMVIDGSGGAIIAWVDDNTYPNGNIYAQRINAAGTVQWTANGVAISTAINSQNNPAIVSNKAGGAIITWDDSRNSSTYEDIYAQKINRYGVLGDPLQIHSVKDVPNDQGGKVIVLWDPSPFDMVQNHTVTSYIVYRGLKESILLKTCGLNKFMNVIESASDNETIYWENYKTVPARCLSGYSCAVETLSDSTAKGNPMYYFMVTAKTSDPLVFWVSPIDSCYSVDNLPPSSPVQPKIVSSPEGKIQLCWNKNNVDPDVDGYTVYRSESTGFTLTNENKLAYVKDTVYIDASASTGQNYYYRIITEDTHGNRSMPSTELSVNSASSLVNSALPITTELLQNYPNPFNPSTSIKYQVSSIEFVSLKVYDMLGRVVKILANEMKNPGVYEVKWNAVNMPSGIYCCRLQAGSYSESKKLILLK